MSGNRTAEAGQHGFWQNYFNIFHLLENELPNVDIDEILTGYAEQGQYSPQGLEAVWPVYQQNPRLPTGLAQALYTKFENLPALDGVAQHGRGRMVKRWEYSESIKLYMNPDALGAYHRRVAEEDVSRMFADVCRKFGLRGNQHGGGGAEADDDGIAVGRLDRTDLTDRQREKLERVDKMFQEVLGGN